MDFWILAEICIEFVYFFDDFILSLVMVFIFGHFGELLRIRVLLAVKRVNAICHLLLGVLGLFEEISSLSIEYSFLNNFLKGAFNAIQKDLLV